MEIKKIELTFKDNHLIVNAYDKKSKLIKLNENKIKRFFLSGHDADILSRIFELLNIKQPAFNNKYYNTGLILNYFVNTGSSLSYLHIIDDDKNIKVNYKTDYCWGLNKPVEDTIKSYPTEYGINNVLAELPHVCAYIKQKYADEIIELEEQELKKYVELKHRQIKFAKEAKDNLYGLEK